MAPHLARSYHHLFPMDSYKEISNEITDVDMRERDPKKPTLHEYFSFLIFYVTTHIHISVCSRFLIMILSSLYFSFQAIALGVNIH